MSKVTRADFALLAGGVDWANITGKPSSFGGTTDIGDLTGAGFGIGQYPAWNGKKFLPATIPDDPTPSDTGLNILPLDTIGVATRRQPPGFPFGPTQDVWFKEVFDVRQYGASANGTYDDTAAFNRAIADINANGRGVLFVPYGNYTAGPFSEIRVPCSIIGAGVAGTTITVSSNGFSGGASGSWFEVAGLQMLSTGTSAFAISLTDGTNAGDFSFHNLDLRHFQQPIVVNGANRRGFIFNSRIDPLVYGLNLTVRDSILANLTMVNDASTSARGMSLAGNYIEAHAIKLVAGNFKWAQGIVGVSGSGGKISDSLFSGVLNEVVSLTDGSSATSGWRVENLTFFDCEAANPVAYNRDKHYVNELQGIGSNTNTDFDSRRELIVNATWDPPVLRPLESTWEEFYLLGAKIGDQPSVGPPYALDFLQVSAYVRAPDIIRCTLTNTSSSTINPASGTFKFRIKN